MSSVFALADSQQNLRAVRVLENSFKSGRLAHAILLHGQCFEALEAVALSLSRALLETEHSPTSHPDCFCRRPTNKMRQISAQDIRSLIRAIQHSPNQGKRKVALLYEADRMNTAAANAFLKTLEEPPTDTTILLLSTRPYSLLPTIRSRCFNVKIPASVAPLLDGAWSAWIEQYQRWIASILGMERKASSSAVLIMGLYGLLTQFETLLATLAKASWEREKESLGEAFSDEEMAALETGNYKRVRHQLLAGIASATRSFVFETYGMPERTALSFARSMDALERSAGLLEVNLNEVTALEAFMLQSLRLWAQCA
jgi:DNA polymerase-3 subunit delta'